MEREVLEKLRLEMRRGSIVLAVLSRLAGEHYGYSLKKTLEEAGIAIDEGTLYPLIRRLEAQGLLTSEWREEGNRKKRFYTRSALGHEVYEQLTQDWQALSAGLTALIEDDTP